MNIVNSESVGYGCRAKFKHGEWIIRGEAIEGSSSVVRVGRDRLVAPQPAHHLREDRATLLLAVIADAPGVVQVVAFRLQRVRESDILQEPVLIRIVRATIVVASVLQENTDGLLLGSRHQFGENVFAADVREAADKGDDFAKIVRAKPRHGEGGASTGTRAHDAVQLRVGRDVVFLLNAGISSSTMTRP